MLESDKILADVVTLVDGYRALEKRCKELESKAVSADKFYNWAVPIEQVASMHGVSPYLVRKYVQLGMIDTHPNSTGAKFLIRGSVALLLNFEELRKEATFKKK